MVMIMLMDMLMVMIMNIPTIVQHTDADSRVGRFVSSFTLLWPLDPLRC